jgi:hypothetical protein
MDYQKFTLSKGPSYPAVIGSVIDPIGAVGLDAIDKILGNTEPIHSRSQTKTNLSPVANEANVAKLKPEAKRKVIKPLNESREQLNAKE